MSRLIIRLRRLLGELDYAQRRALELRTGVSMTGPRPPSRRDRRRTGSLCELWQLDGEPADTAERSEHAYNGGASPPWSSG